MYRFAGATLSRAGLCEFLFDDREEVSAKATRRTTDAPLQPLAPLIKSQQRDLVGGEVPKEQALRGSVPPLRLQCRADADACSELVLDARRRGPKSRGRRR